MRKAYFTSILISALIGKIQAVTAQSLSKANSAYEAKNYTLAVQLYQTAYAAGSGEAAYRTGLMYDKGSGVPQDLSKAFGWYQKAANKGYVQAMISLAEMYDAGDGTAKDAAQSYHWYQKAAQGGHAEGMYNTGIMLMNGQGTAADIEEAGEWFKKSIAGGYEKAKAGYEIVGKELFNQGLVAYQNQRFVESAQLYTKAAAYNNPEAMHNLAAQYYKGEGVTANATTARQWFSKAANMGFELSKSSLAKINAAEKTASPSGGTLDNGSPASSGLSGRLGNSNTLNMGNLKTYVFQSQCSSQGRNFTVVSKIDADLSRFNFDQVKNAALKAIGSNGWYIQSDLKYLGTSDAVVLQGKAGRDYALSTNTLF